MELELEAIFEGRKQLTAAFIKAFFVHEEYRGDSIASDKFPSAGSFVFNSLGPTDYSWTVGGNSNFQHMEVLGHGAYGEVHEVQILPSRIALTVDTKYE